MPTLLAVDTGLRTGLALYGGDGRLAWYRSQHYAGRSTLRRAARGLIRGEPGLAFVVIEGGGPLAEAWRREAEGLGVGVLAIAAERWRERLGVARHSRDRDRPKRAADLAARRVIAWSGAPRPTSLRHDAAEAILVGLWGVLELGWLDALPDGVIP